MKDDAYYASRRQFLQTLAATGAIAVADLAWWEEPFLGPRRARAAASTVQFMFNVPEPLRTPMIESLVERFNKSQSDVEVKVEFVPETQARHKLVAALSAGNPPDCCQIWDTWLGEFDAMGALEDLTERIKAWKFYASTFDTAWQTVSVKGKIVSLPLALECEQVFIRTDRVKEYGLKMPGPDWTWDEFLTLARGLNKPEKNQYGFGMRGAGKWAVQYATEFLYGNGAQVLKDGKVVINSPEAVKALEWYIDLFRKWKVTPPSVPTDGYREIVEGFARGVTSMYLHNSASVEEQKKFVGEANFATLPFPIGPAKKRATFYFTETLTMLKAAKNKDAVWKFLAWMMEDEQHFQYNKTLGSLPTRQALLNRPPFTGPGYSGSIKSFSFATVSPYLAYAGWGGKLDSDGVPLLQQAIVGQISAKDCLDRWADVLKMSMV
jgi:multiple sugar transport system substrate-binding protein